jgi:hypothetical protein
MDFTDDLWKLMEYVPLGVNTGYVQKFTVTIANGL